MTFKRRALQEPKRALTINERESISAEIRSKETMLKAGEHFGEGDYTPSVPQEVTLSRSQLAGEVAHLKKMLATESPERMTNQVKRDKLVARRKELERMFLPFLETREELKVMDPRDPAYQTAMEKAGQRGSVNALILEWRELGKQLEPDDPRINNLDRLRSAK